MSGDQGIDQILAQIRKVIADEPQQKKPSMPTSDAPQAAPSKDVVKPTPQLPQPFVVATKTTPASVPTKPLASSGFAKPPVAGEPAKPGANGSVAKTLRQLPPDDLSDLIETSAPKTTAPATPHRMLEPVVLAAPPVPLPIVPPKPEPVSAPTTAVPAAAEAKPVSQTALVAPPLPQQAIAATPVAAPASVAQVVLRAPEIPPLLGVHRSNGKAPMSLANMVANGSISMPSAVVPSIKPPDTHVSPEIALVAASKASSALGDLAAGLAASGQAAPVQTAAVQTAPVVVATVPALPAANTAPIPTGLEDQILERLRPTVREWLEANAGSLAKGAPTN